MLNSLITYNKETSDILMNVHCIGFVWQGFGSGAATAVASVGSCQKLSSCLTEPVPTGSDGLAAGQG